MSDNVFLDTNVLVYAFGAKRSSMPDPRAEVAQRIVIDGAMVSVQVLNEFAQVCHGKVGLPWDRIIATLQVIKELCGPAVPLTVDLHEMAVELSRRHGFRIYDSLILAAAIKARCTTLLTEDLQRGQVVEGVRVENPFLLAQNP